MTRFESFTLREKALAGGTEPEVVKGALVTYDFFNMMGVEPQLGRNFRPEEDVPQSGVGPSRMAWGSAASVVTVP